MEIICELHLRLKNCLQTIIDLEMDISSLPMYVEFHNELKTIKEFINKIENLNVTENDVLRLEKATEKFLKELQLPLSRNMYSLYIGKRFH